MKSNPLIKLALFVFIGLAFFTHAHATDVQCTFTKDLALGDTSEEVRCLQKYLNGAGFVVASSGVGSPGNETSLYREKTVEAVKKWQKAKGISPATGSWGPLSRLTYTKVLAAALEIKPTTPASTPETKPVVTPTPKPVAPADKEARIRLTSALDAIDNAQADYDDAEEAEDEVGDSREMIDDAHFVLFRALRAFLAGEYANSIDYANSVRNKAGKAQDEIKLSHKSKYDDNDAQDALDDAENWIDDAQEDIDKADDRGHDVDEANDLLDEARDLFDDAENSFDDEEYEDVIRLVKKIENRVNEAIDAID